MPSTDAPPFDAARDLDDKDPSGRTPDSLPTGAGEAGRTDESGRASEDVEGDPAIHENEDGDGL